MKTIFLLSFFLLLSWHPSPVTSNIPKQNNVCQAERAKAIQARGEFIKFMVVYENGEQKLRLLNRKELTEAIKKIDLITEYANCLDREIKKKG